MTGVVDVAAQAREREAAEQAEAERGKRRGLCPCGKEGTVKRLEQGHAALCPAYGKLYQEAGGVPDLHKLYQDAHAPGPGLEPDSGEPDTRRQEADDREARIRAGAAQVTSWLADVFAAYEARQWEVYGYGDWDSYTAARLPELRKALADKDERARAIGWLSGAGMSTRAIANATGSSQSTVVRQLTQNGSDTDSDGSGDSRDGASSGSGRPDQVTSRDGAKRPARQSATERETRKDQREALAKGRAAAAAAGNSGMPKAERIAYEAAWEELRRLAPGLHKITREGVPPKGFFEPARNEDKEVWRTNRDGERYFKELKRLKVPLTGDYLVTLIMTILRRGKEGLGPDADRAGLLAQIHALAAEVDRLAAAAGQRDEAAMKALEELFPNG
jgi:hypothetical protein